MAKRSLGAEGAGSRETPRRSHPKANATKLKAAAARKPGAATKVKVQSGKSASADEARQLEALDAAKPKKPALEKGTTRATTRASHALRNSDFPRTYIKEISVSLEDPDHWMRLKWTGPNASSQETGPFRTSPGAGMKGLNC